MIARKTWREAAAMTFVYFLLLQLLMAPAILLWPDLREDLQKSLFVKFMMALGAQSIGEGITHRDADVAYLSWMALQLFFKGVNLAGIAASVLLGTALFAREREAATMEFLLSRPVSRSRLLWQKWWPTMLCVVVPIFLANWTSIWWSRQIGLELPFWPLTLCCVHGALFVLAFLAFTTWVSVLCRVQAHVAFWVGGITILQIGIYLIPKLRRWSLFHVSDFDWYAPLLLGNLGLREMFDPVNHRGLSAWLVVATVVFYLLALRALRRLTP